MRHTIFGWIFAINLIGALGLHAEEEPTKQTLLERQASTMKLYEAAAKSWEALEAAVAEGRKAGVSEQAIVEAQAFHEIRIGDGTHTESIIEQIEGFENWDYARSLLATNETEFKAVVAMMQARKAYYSRDEPAFAQAVKEAFWLNPKMAQLLVSWIEDYRLEDQMSSVVFPMHAQLAQSSGGEMSLAEVAEGKKAALISFWASWCGPCIQLMPELVKRSEILGKQGVAVVGINIENSEKAEPERTKRQIQFPWLVDQDGRTVASSLNIESYPRAVLVAPDGKILFNGHPMDPRLKTALKEIEVTL